MRAGVLFVAPAVLAIAVFFLGPVLFAFAVSLTDFDIYALADTGNLRFVGLDNYMALYRSPHFWRAVANTVYLVAVGVPLSIGVSLTTALLLNSRLVRFRGLFRTCLFAPVVTTVVAVAVVWRYLFNTQYGLINFGLAQLGVSPVDWLGDPTWSMPSIILFSVWKEYGYNMLIFLAGLQAIPLELYEAARMDGANALQRFRHVTLPSLSPIVLLVSILTVARYFQLFAEPYVMTEGGPLQSTITVLYLMYEDGFQWWSLGRASAVAFSLAVVMLVVTILQVWVAGRRGDV